MSIWWGLHLIMTHAMIIHQLKPQPIIWQHVRVRYTRTEYQVINPSSDHTKFYEAIFLTNPAYSKLIKLVRREKEKKFHFVDKTVNLDSHSFSPCSCCLPQTYNNYFLLLGDISFPISNNGINKHQFNTTLSLYLVTERIKNSTQWWVTVQFVDISWERPQPSPPFHFLCVTYPATRQALSAHWARTWVTTNLSISSTSVQPHSYLYE